MFSMIGSLFYKTEECKVEECKVKECKNLANITCNECKEKVCDKHIHKMVCSKCNEKIMVKMGQGFMIGEVFCLGQDADLPEDPSEEVPSEVQNIAPQENSKYPALNAQSFDIESFGPPVLKL